MKRNTLAVILQGNENNLHPITKKVITTAIALSREKGYKSQGVLFINKLSDRLKEEIKNCGLDEVAVFESTVFNSFIPEAVTDSFCSEFSDNTDILLVSATPEGRAISSMIASRLHTGVTADCTELSFDENGILIQTRPAFSGNIMASIETKTRPQIASLRFGTAVEKTDKKTEIVYKKAVASKISYEARWLDEAGATDNKSNFIIAVGGGLKSKDDIEIFKKLADKLGFELYSSRALVDRGYLKKKTQIGLSGQSVSPKILITFGISGSLQFRAGLENVDKIIAVNTDENAPIMKLADVAIVGDMYEIAEELLK